MSGLKFVCALAIAGLTAVATVIPTSAAETLRLAHHHAVGGAVDLAAQKFADLVNEKSGGQIAVQVFPGAQLGQEREAFDLVEQGALDISMTTTSFLDKVLPAVAVNTMPFVFRDWDHARAAYGGEFGETIRSSVRDAGETEVLAYLGVGFRHFYFTSAEPVTKLDEIAGRLLRSPENYAYLRMIELVGARPTPITWGEVYTSLQTGVADGFEAPPGVVVDSKLYEVAKSSLRSNHMFSVMVFAMNKTRFASLPHEMQDHIREAALEAADWAEREVVIPAEVAAFATFESAGLTLSEPENPSEWAAAVKPMVDELASNTPGAAELLDQLAN